MRKFNTVIKQKQLISEQLLEKKILGEFKKVYSDLLEQYNTNEFNDLNEKTQIAFISELNEYWTEEEGLSAKGKNFLDNKSLLLTESSTDVQKRNFLKKKAVNVISESFNNTGIKNNLYDILDEMFKNTKSSEISDVLNISDISNTLLESFTISLEALMTEMVYEMSDEE